MNSFRFRVLSGLLLTLVACNSTLHAASIETTEDSTLVHGLKLSVAVALAASLVKFFCTEPHNEPVRYNVEECKRALAEIQEGVNIVENLHKVRSFTWYLIIDGLIGHGTKKRSIRIDPDEPKKIMVHPGAKSKGLYGYIYGYHKGIFAMGMFTAGLATFLKKGTNGWQSLKDFVFHPIRFINGDFSKNEGPSSDAIHIANALQEVLRESMGMQSH